MGWCGSSWISNFTVNGEDASDCPECGCVEDKKVGKLIKNSLKYFGNKKTKAIIMQKIPVFQLLSSS